MHYSMDENIKELVLKTTNSHKINDIEIIQNLWSGYGQLCRVKTESHSVIVKLITFPTRENHPRGWNTDFSHQRKVKSYQVEMNWYRQYVQKIENAKMAKLLLCGEENSHQYLILEDLLESNFYPKHSPYKSDINLCLKWMASFHAHYLKVSPEKLWESGTYWHLATRPHELEALEDKELKNVASLIDKKLNDAKYQTLVHGDAKLANFLFRDNDVAAVDFQYVGGGVGVKDLAYFLSSIFSEDELFEKEESCLNYYFDILNSLCGEEGDKIEAEWRELYPYAWCDFYRFLQGWSPGHPKINQYSEQMKNKVLSCL